VQSPAKKQGQSGRPEWVNVVSRYQTPSVWKSWGQVASTLVPFLLLWYLMYLSLGVGYWLTLLLSIPAALFMVRIFILQHDCGHGSFFKSNKMNNRLGMVLSLFTFVPYHYWRRTHAIHHSATGDLEHRGVGDFFTMTVNEYVNTNNWGRVKYRLYRNPITMFFVAPLFVFVVGYRFDFLKRKNWKKERRGLLWTNIALLALVVTLSLVFGFKEYLLIQLPITYIATGLGSWFFFVQHNFEDAYWDQKPTWDYATAALHGSSYYKLPKVLQWFTGSIGFHHIHHLSPKIPNYLLEKCHEENPMFQDPPTLTLGSSFSTLNLSLWDEERQKLITFGQLKEMKQSGPVPA
jgi:omega-6 fatty acid desaturase (delta-12 desaturase)